MILLDSNIVIGYLNGDERIVATLDNLKRDRVALLVSSITVTETLSLSSITMETLRTVEDFLDGFIVIPPDKYIAKVAATLRREHRIEVPDALIVATARSHALALATRDKKLRSIPNIVLADM